jgi:hypothetical protein
MPNDKVIPFFDEQGIPWYELYPAAFREKAYRIVLREHSRLMGTKTILARSFRADHFFGTAGLFSRTSGSVFVGSWIYETGIYNRKLTWDHLRKI